MEVDLRHSYVNIIMRWGLSSVEKVIIFTENLFLKGAIIVLRNNQSMFFSILELAMILVQDSKKLH